MAETVEEKQRRSRDFETAYTTEPDPASPRAWLATRTVSRYTRPRTRAGSSGRRQRRAKPWRSTASRRGPSRAGRGAHDPQELRRGARAIPDRESARPDGRRGLAFLGAHAGTARQAEEERNVYEAAIARRPHCYKPRWWLAAWSTRTDTSQSAKWHSARCSAAPRTSSTAYSKPGRAAAVPRRVRACHRHAAHRRGTDANVEAPTTTWARPTSTPGSSAGAVDAYNQAFQFGDADYVMWMNLGDAYYCC
jgi:hypothetical protein